MSLARPISPAGARRAGAPARTVSRVTVRKLIFDVHLWVGIALSLWFVLLGLTGALLVFKPQVDAFLHPSLLRSRPVPPGSRSLTADEAMVAARTAYPEVSFRRLAYPDGDLGVYEFRYGAEKQEREVFIDRYSGKVLGERPHHGHLMDQVLELHKALLLGKAGEQANGIGALLLIALLATGIYLWWPANSKQWLQRLTVKTGASTKRLLFDLHNAFGVYTLPVFLVIAVTGAVFIYKKPVERAVYAVTGSPLEMEKKYEKEPIEKRTGKPTGSKGVGSSGQGSGLRLAALLDQSASIAPGTRLKHIELPVKHGSPLRIHRERTRGFRVNNKVRVELDPTSGAVLRVLDERNDPLGKRIMRWNGPLHEGRWAGVGTQWLYLALALFTPLGLGVTGVVKWWQTRSTRARNRERKEVAARA